MSRSDDEQIEERTCPSGRCTEGAVLLGIVGPDSRLGYVRPALTIDSEFVSRAREGRTPESRFRFAEPCAEGRCAQWAGDRCGLIDEILESPRAVPAPSDEASGVPRCSIRPSCRWYDQRGLDACTICPLVVHTRRAPAGHA